MRILVTGGAGFIGSHLVDRLMTDGHYVIAMDNLITGKFENIQAHTSSTRFEFIHHNVSNFIHVAGDIDFVVHLASPASPVDYLELPIQTLKVNSLGTHNTLGLATVKNAKYLLASTSEVYGDPEVHPQPETYWGNVNPIGPRGVYDESKRFAEALTMAYHKMHGLDTRIIRIFNCYGPRLRLDDGRVISNFIRQSLEGEPLTVYGEGNQTRSFQYVSDLVDGIVKTMNSDHHLPINLGNPQEKTVDEIAKLIKQLTGTRSEIVFKELPVDDPRRRLPDITKAKELLGWTPKTELVDGLKQTIAWFETQVPKVGVK
ncbi:MAG: UDP-glucuronic acid decarboxylase family protein [Candidatus Melainabacteria bacterium]|nr:UDP-glucuronic acid decarboxylase family protein [Candidatus Melainabacteria bacterium]